MKVLKEIKNNLLRRKEITFVIESNSNPGFKNSKKSIVEKLKAPEENVVVKSVKNNFGTREFLIESFIYDSKVDKERIEPKFKKEKQSKKAGGKE
ncbi:hypothetical protein HYV50_03450 [Candidatus Pacearchaeota archaeon]|nr:hypothetical protein [Candidatus Pacearchaeota archaeon]